MTTKRKINGHVIRSAAWAGFLSFAFIALSLAFNSPNRWHKGSGLPGARDTAANALVRAETLAFAERVAFQRAIEEVYWHHRIWPKENANPKPALDALMSQAQIENKVAGYLRDSQALEDHWQKPITAEQLQARWTGWPSIQSSQKSCGNSLRLLETIWLSSPSVWPDQF